MSHFSSADEFCKHESDVDVMGDEGCEDNGGNEVEEEREKVGEEEGEGDSNGKDGEEGATFSKDIPFVAAKSRWHDTMDVPITATDLSALLMMRASNSSLLPG